MKKTVIFSIIIGIFFSAYGQNTTQSLGPLSEIYAKSGIKIGVPAGFSIIEESDCIWMKDDGTTPVDAFVCRIRSDNGDGEVMVRGFYPAFLKEGQMDNITSPLRYAEREMKLLDNIQGKENESDGPFLVEDRLSCISGELVRRICNADRIYYYDVDLSKTKFVKSKGRSEIVIDGLTCAKRAYICKEGGYYLTFLVLLPNDDEKLFLNILMDVSNEIWFDGNEIRKKWTLVNATKKGESLY